MAASRALALLLPLELVLGSPTTTQEISLLQPVLAKPGSKHTPKPTHGPQSNFRPVCQVRLDERCEEGRAEVPCPKDGNLTYFLDHGLASSIEKNTRGNSIIEFGAGEGCYTGALRDYDVEITGYDKVKGIFAKTQGLVQYADVLQPQLDVGCADFVLSLDMAEHVPAGKMETRYLRNLHTHSSKGIILSWASSSTSQFTDKLGEEHVIQREPRAVNYVDEADVIVKMAVLGYQHDSEMSKKLRTAARHVPWLRTSLFYFVKNKPSDECPSK